MDPLLLVEAGFAIALTIGVWALAARRGRLAHMPIRRGLLNGAVVAGAIGVVIAVLVAIAMNGQTVLFSGPLNLGAALTFGVLLGAPTAIGFFWLGLLLMPIGLLIRPNAGWATTGTWFAVPIAAPIAALVLYIGHMAFRAIL